MDSLKFFSSKNKNKPGFLSGLISKITFIAGFKEKKDHWLAGDDLNKKLIFSLSKSRIPSLSQLKYIKKFLSPKELFLIRVSFLAIAVSLAFVGFGFYKNHLQTVAVKGGEYLEGLIGSPKFINPLYSNISDVDNDLTSLIFSSLYKRDGQGGLAKDLAVDSTISGDNKIYTISLRENVKWHNGNSLTADDVVFTFNAIKDANFKSTMRASFNGVEIEKVDEKTIKFILSEPYAAFSELLTFGIMPSELWSQIPPETANLAELNLKPVGSGPYKFSKLTRDKATGAIFDFSLVPNDDYYLKPALVNLRFKFFPNFEEAVAALKDNSVDGLSYLPKEIEKNLTVTNSYNLYKLHIPQLTLIYLNAKNNPALANKELRRALMMAIDRNKIINDVFDGEAYIVDGPILPASFAYNNKIKKYDFNPAEAVKIIDNLGWKIEEIKAESIADSKANLNSSDKEAAAKARKIIEIGVGKWRIKDGNFLTIRLATVDRAENQQVISLVKDFWESLGVKTILELYSPADIQKGVIKTRNFEALFYGLVVGSDPDPYAFWHSSQAVENGFNIANFSNKEADQLLEDARLTIDNAKRQEKYNRFQEIMAEEIPAIFMYSPAYTYIQDKKVKRFDVSDMVYPSDRFANITDWYIMTGRKIIW